MGDGEDGAEDGDEEVWAVLEVFDWDLELVAEVGGDGVDKDVCQESACAGGVAWGEGVG